MFFTNWAAADVVNPIASLPVSGKGKNGGWFGWPEDAKLEELRDAYARSSSPDDQKKIAAELQARVYEQVIYIPLGQYTAPSAWRKSLNVVMLTLTGVAALSVVSVLFLILGYLIWHGGTSLSWNFFTQLPKPVGETGGGMGNAIVGTFILLGQAAIIGVPVGVLGGVFLSEYGGTKLNWAIRFAADILNGVPSITWGIVVYALMVVPMHGFSALAGGVGKVLASAV